MDAAEDRGPDARRRRDRRQALRQGQQAFLPGGHRIGQSALGAHHALEAGPRPPAQRAENVLGGDGVGAFGIAQLHRVTPARSRQERRRSRPRRTHDLTVPSGCRRCRASSECDSPWKNASAIACFCAGLQCVDAVLDRERVRAGKQQLERSGSWGRKRQTFLLIVHRYGFDFAPAQLIQAAIADDAGQPRQRLALGGDVRRGMVPDVDEAFLQNLLGSGRFTQYTQRHGEQMRRSHAVELRERLLILHCRARQQLHEARVALELLCRVAGHDRSARRAGGPSATGRRRSRRGG